MIWSSQKKFFQSKYVAIWPFKGFQLSPLADYGIFSPTIKNKNNCMKITSVQHPEDIEIGYLMS